MLIKLFQLLTISLFVERVFGSLLQTVDEPVNQENKVKTVVTILLSERFQKLPILVTFPKLFLDSTPFVSVQTGFGIPEQVRHETGGQVERRVGALMRYFEELV